MIEGKAWDRCPLAEMANDSFTTEWLSRYQDFQRLNVRPSDLDDLSSRMVTVFRIIDSAILDVHRREGERAKKKKDREDKKRNKGKGPATKGIGAAQSKARSAARRAGSSSRRR